MPPEDVHFTGVMHMRQGRKVEAMICFDHCLRVQPNYWEAWSNRGAILYEIGHHFDAVMNFNQALAIKPNVFETYMMRGQSWAEQGCVESAIKDYNKALELNPRCKEAYVHIGMAREMLGDREGAIECYQQAYEIDPTYTDAELYLSMAEIETGRLEAGWQHFEARWRCGQLPLRDFSSPLWRGEDLNDKKLLLFAEQGLGDVVHFIRYAAVIRDKWPNAHVVVEVRRTLQRLAATVPGVDQVVLYGEPHGPYNFVLPMMSAPRLCGTNTFADIPSWPHYMTPPEYGVYHFRNQLKHDLLKAGKDLNAQLVGICWAGMGRPIMPQANAVDQKRSTHLNQWAPLAQIPGVIFVSLQEGPPGEQVKQPPAPMVIWNNSDGFDDFADTAALMKCLDLVISVDTAVVHVAAATGCPTWMLSRFDGCWRWHGNRSDSPWYPTLRQFRQPRPRDWDPVFREVADELTKFVAEPIREAAE